MPVLPFPHVPLCLFQLSVIEDAYLVKPLYTVLCQFDIIWFLYTFTIFFPCVLVKEPKGTCDGAFMECRYFMCEDKHWIILPASHLVLPYRSRYTQAASKAPCGELLLPLASSTSGQEFWKDDRVFLFDKDGRRISGKVKWALRVKNVQAYVIGIETDVRNTYVQ